MILVESIIYIGNVRDIQILQNYYKSKFLSPIFIFKIRQLENIKLPRSMHPIIRYRIIYTRKLIVIEVTLFSIFFFFFYLIRGRRGRLREGRSENCATIVDRRATRPPSRRCASYSATVANRTTKPRSLEPSGPNLLKLPPPPPPVSVK